MRSMLTKSIVGLESKRLAGFYLTIGSLAVLLAGAAQAEQLPIRTYTIADGLAHSAVVSIYQDHKGFLWFGTYEGLSRFDGYGFVNYDRRDGLPHVLINHITEDRQGRLWVATNGGGVARLVDDSRENSGAKFVSFRIPETNDPPLKRVNHVNRMVFDESGNLWCLTDYGLYRAVVDAPQLQFETIIEKNSYGSRAALEDADGTLWFGVADDLVEIRGTEILDRGSIEGASDSTTIAGIARDGDGHLLVADLHRVREFVPPSFGKPRGEWRKQLALPSRQIGSIRTLLVDDAGALWLGTDQGLMRYADGRPSQYTVANGLPTDVVGALATDRAGNLWIGTWRGACRLISEAIVSYTRSEGLPGNTVSLYEDEKGRIWAVLVDGSVAEIVGGKIAPRGRRALPFIATPPVRLVYSNKIWYRWNHESGVRIDKPRLDLGNGQEIDLARYVSPQAHLYKDERGVLWIAKADHNIYRLNLNGAGALTAERFPTDADYGVPYTQMIGDGAGGLWLGTVEKIGRLRDGRYSSVEPSAGLPETDPRAVFLDSRGWLWVGLRYKGVSVTQEPATANPTFHNYSHEQGQLSSNAVRSIAEDRAGRIYFGTDRGLDRFDPNSNQWTHFTTQDGLAGNAISKVLIDHNGFIWIGSEGGISRFDPRKEKAATPPAAVYFTRLQVAGEEVRLAETEAEIIAPRELAATKNNLTIAFVAPNYQDVSQLLYQYKLEGVEEEWRAPTQERSVTFGSLAAGKYRFLVRAVGENGIISPQPAVFEFRILPPIYLRWWFIAASLLAAGLAIYSLYRARVARLLEMERTRTRIATDLHDDIGANLTRIALLSEVANQQPGNDKIKTLLPSIADIARESVASMNDIVWAISPEHDSLVELTRRMRRHAEEVFALRDIDLDFTGPTTDSDLKLSVGARRDLLLIFKEAVNNAARHSLCTKIEIEFRCDHWGLYLKVKDDGQGFNPAVVDSSGHGLRSMQRRAAALGGILTIQSIGGTTVEFALPLPKGTASHL
ncbi:MAG TPA: two-component regulator propeller domain-containing protein [Blastocatellia bacterium]|nr:two-component regulator propeller domain-containing protein [Blastocatellia bacterium]